MKAYKFTIQQVEDGSYILTQEGIPIALMSGENDPSSVMTTIGDVVGRLRPQPMIIYIEWRMVAVNA